MRNHMVGLLKSTVRLASVACAVAVAAALAAPGYVARPGTVNYAEGTVTVAGQAIGAKQLGQTEVAPGQVLETAQGKAEMLLTPGVLLRIGDNTAVRMVSPSLTDTRVDLLRGEAMIEAQQVKDENRIAIADNGVDTLIEKKGLYRFDADQPMVSVYDGKVKVLADDRTIEVGKGKELALGTETKARKFDRDRTDELYAWSKLRSSYMAEANEASAQTIVVDGLNWGGPGWYWNRWYGTWAFLPGTGYLTSPFGFGYYSPGYWYSVGPRFYPYRYRIVPVQPGPVFRAPSGRGMTRGIGPAHGSGPAHGRPSQPAGRPSLGRGARM